MRQRNKQKEFLNELTDIKIGRRTTEQNEVINNFTIQEKLLIFLETILKCYLMLIRMQNKMKQREQD